MALTFCWPLNQTLMNPFLLSGCQFVLKTISIQRLYNSSSVASTILLSRNVSPLRLKTNPALRCWNWTSVNDDLAPVIWALFRFPWIIDNLAGDVGLCDEGKYILNWYHFSFLHALIGIDYFLQAWRTSAGMGGITFFWHMSYSLLFSG